MARLHRFAAWLGVTAFVVLLNSAARGDPMPWYNEGPQPHGPGGTVLVNHIPSNVGGLAADTQFSEFPFAERSADDFSLSQAAVISRLVWWGWYDLNILPLIDETFRIRVYDQRPGDLLPGAVLFEQTLSNVPRSWTGRFVLISGAPREFRYEVEFPQSLLLSANIPYWLEIVQVGDVNSFFAWEYSQNTSLNGAAFINSITTDWTYTQSVVSNAAFQLIGTIPEPTSFALVAIVGVALIHRRSRHRS